MNKIKLRFTEMSHWKKSSIIAAGILLAGVSVLGSSKLKNALEKPAVPLEKAVEIAKASFPGQVIEAELENENGLMVWEVEIVAANNIKREILIDSSSGKIIAEEESDDDDDDD